MFRGWSAEDLVSPGRQSLSVPVKQKGSTTSGRAVPPAFGEFALQNSDKNGNCISAESIPPEPAGKSGHAAKETISCTAGSGTAALPLKQTCRTQTHKSSYDNESGMAQSTSPAPFRFFEMPGRRPLHHTAKKETDAPVQGKSVSFCLAVLRPFLVCISPGCRSAARSLPPIRKAGQVRARGQKPAQSFSVSFVCWISMGYSSARPFSTACSTSCHRSAGQ